MTKYMMGAALMTLLMGAAVRGQKTPGPEQELMALENTWKNAVIQRDGVTLRHLYADEYTSTDQEGLVWTRDQDIAIDTDRSERSRLTGSTLDDMKVRLYGDVAVVTGRNTSKGTVFGRSVSSRARFTDVFVKRDARWQCVATHVTAITAEQ